MTNVVPPPFDFFSLTPCRVVDTRTAGGPLIAGIERTVPFAGACGIPAEAAAVSINVAVTQPTAAGNVRLYPAGSLPPTVSTINYAAGQTRTNNAIVGLGTAGALAARNQPAGSTHLIVDVNGYFAPPCAGLPASNVGCEFYAVPLANTLLTPGFSFAVAVANTTRQTASITISGGALPAPQTHPLPPEGVLLINLPWVPGLQTTSATVLSAGGAYRIVSDRPISAYQFNPLQYAQGGQFSYTNDASLLLPVRALGGSYRIAAWPSWFNQPGYFAVIGTEDQTTVSIAPSANILAGGGLSTSGGSINLNRADVLQVLAPPPGATTYSNDLSGSVVTATKPVAVFGGHDATFIPATSGYADHLEEQLPPVETLGTELVVTLPPNPQGPPSKHYVKVVGIQDGTSLASTPAVAGAPVALNAGQVVTFEATQDFRMVSSHPVIAAQYFEGSVEVVVGDPAMGIVVPTEQFRPQYVFVAPSNFPQNWVTIVAPTGATVRLDGIVVDAASFATIPGTSWAVARVALSGATDKHQLAASAPVGAYVYGYADYTSYMFPAGMGLQR